jgi:hypothetical protein
MVVILAPEPWVLIQMVRVEPEIEGLGVYAFTRNRNGPATPQFFAVAYSLRQDAAPPPYGGPGRVSDLLPVIDPDAEASQVALAVSSPLRRNQAFWTAVIQNAQPKGDLFGRTLPPLERQDVEGMEVWSDGLSYGCPCQAVVQATNAARSDNGGPSRELTAAGCGGVCPHTDVYLWGYPYPGFS